eukprot:5173133-Prymnesium_polylepis.1
MGAIVSIGTSELHAHFRRDTRGRWSDARTLGRCSIVSVGTSELHAYFRRDTRDADERSSGPASQSLRRVDQSLKFVGWLGCRILVVSAGLEWAALWGTVRKEKGEHC